MAATEQKQGLGPVSYGGKTFDWGKGARAGGFVFLAGVEGYLDDDGNVVAGLREQTRLMLDRAQQWLADAGATFDDVVQMNQYLGSRANREEYMKHRDEWLAENAARLHSERSYASILVCPELVFPDMFVETQITAYVGDRR